MKDANIHNNFILNILKKKENSIDFLKICLPEEIKKGINYKKINFDDTTYIQKNLKEYFSDIVIKTEITNEQTDIYFLIEHKSTFKTKEIIFIQLLKYMSSMWEDDIKNQKELRIIIPIVLYHGKNKWNIPENFKDLYKISEGIKSICWILNIFYLIRKK